MKSPNAVQIFFTVLSLIGSTASQVGAYPLPMPTVAPPTVAPPPVLPAPTVVTPAPGTPTTNNPTASRGVVFRCVTQGSGYATVADNGKQQATLIAWNTTHFGPEYTPEKRCQMVSSKLTAVVTANGGSLRNLQLSNGPVNNQMVICYLNGGKTICDPTNQLFTLKPENAGRAAQILETITNFGKEGSGTIYENSGDQGFVNLEQWADRVLGTTQELPAVEHLPVVVEQIPAIVEPSEGQVTDGWVF